MIFRQKYFVMSEKSSTFACFFAARVRGRVRIKNFEL